MRQHFTDFRIFVTYHESMLHVTVPESKKAFLCNNFNLIINLAVKTLFEILFSTKESPNLTRFYFIFRFTVFVLNRFF